MWELLQPADRRPAYGLQTTHRTATRTVQIDAHTASKEEEQTQAQTPSTTGPITTRNSIRHRSQEEEEEEGRRSGPQEKEERQEKEEEPPQSRPPRPRWITTQQQQPQIDRSPLCARVCV